MAVCRQDIVAQRLHPWLVLCCIVRLSSSYAFCKHIDPRPYISEPTVFENYVHDLYVDDQLVELSLWDTAGAFLYASYMSSLRFLSHGPCHTVVASQVRKSLTDYAH